VKTIYRIEFTVGKLPAESIFQMSGDDSYSVLPNGTYRVLSSDGATAILRRLAWYELAMLWPRHWIRWYQKASAKWRSVGRAA
jgi:hypothetical protein